MVLNGGWFPLFSGSKGEPGKAGVEFRLVEFIFREFIIDLQSIDMLSILE